MSGVILGREHWYAAIARRWNRAWGIDTDPTPLIYIRTATGPGTWVVVEPSRGIESVYFHKRSEAVRHARALHALHGWPIAPAPQQEVL